MWRVPEALRTPANAGVIHFLEDVPLSAHGDVAEELQLGAEGLPGVSIWCPDRAAYAFTILTTATGVIMGVAYGLDTLALRLPGNQAADALANGAARVPEIGETWVSLHPFDPDEPTEAFRARFRELCRVASTAV
jgi:hypothetical protein